MEHPCSKCGAEVEEGVPFCPQCNAPQIRVQSAVTEAATPPMPPGTPEEVQPPAEPLKHAYPSQQTPLTMRPQIMPSAVPETNLSSARRAALWAGVIAGLGSLVPFVPFILLCMIAAGGMSIAFYSRREPQAEVRPSAGMKIGAMAGLFGFLMNGTLSTLSLLSPATRSAIRGEMVNRLNEAMASSTDPAATAMLRKIGDQLNTAGGLATFFALAIGILGLFFIFFGAIGGAVGASLFGRRSH